MFNCINLSTIAPYAVLLAAIVTGLISIILWFLNKIKEREQENRIKREDRYKGFIENMPGLFLGNSLSKVEREQMKSELINHYNFMALYCNDELYKKASEFLNSINTDLISQQENEVARIKRLEDRETLIRELILLMRNDLANGKRVKKTRLGTKDIHFFNPTDRSIS
jgi:hypothetical protein